MKRITWPHLLWGALLGLLLLSLAVNWFAYQRARQYYVQLNGLRLDPLGLNYFAGDTIKIDETKITAVFLGDSRAEYWPVPGNLPQFQFINRGISSQTSAQVQLRFDEQIRPLSPDILILQLGINDLTRLPTFPHLQADIVANCKENIHWLVEQTSAMGTVVILTTILPVGDVPLVRRPFWSNEIETAVSDVNDYIHTLASEQVIVFDAFTILADENGRLRDEYAADELHLNQNGYDHLNQALTPLLKTIATP